MSADRGIHTLNEIRSQAEAWEGTMSRIDSRASELGALIGQAEEIVVAGCGSGCNIAHAVAPVLQKASAKTCRAVHSSEIFTYPHSFLNRDRKTLAIVFSRSGTTTESVMATHAAKAAGHKTLAIVCLGRSPMAKDADAALVLEEAVEQSVTTTRSFTAMVLAGYYLAHLAAGNGEACRELGTLPGLVRARMAGFESLGKAVSENPDIAKYAFLGSGSRYGLAREAQLKVKEMVLLPADSYVSLDYQHGPMSNVDERMLVTVLASDAGQIYDAELVRNMKRLGGKVFVLCNRSQAACAADADYRLDLDVALGDDLRDVLYMPALQFLATYKSLAVGCDPDNPKNLSYFVALEHTDARRS
jgi:glutamine---fructose-6-phosphate transaminase (isomerizing)